MGTNMIHVVLYLLIVTACVKFKATSFSTIEPEAGSGDIDDANFMQNDNAMQNSTTLTDNTTEQTTAAVTSNSFSSGTESSVAVTTIAPPTSSLSSSLTFTSAVTTTSISTTTISDSHKTSDNESTTLKGISTSKLLTTDYTEEPSTKISVSESNYNVTSLRTEGTVINTSSDSSTSVTVALSSMSSERSISPEGTTGNESSTMHSTTSGVTTDLSVESMSTESVTQPKITTSMLSKFSTESETTTIIFTSKATSDTSVSITNKSMETDKGDNSDGQKDYTLKHLAYILPCAFLIVLVILFSVGYTIRRKRRKQKQQKTIEQDVGYVLKRQRSFSNPAFMEQNFDTVAYQFNSRDSMAPSALQNKLQKYGNSFDEIDLKEEDTETTDQIDIKENKTTVGDSSFKKSSFKKSSFKKNANKPEYRSNDMLNKSETNAISSLGAGDKAGAVGSASLEHPPPLPGKGQKNADTVMTSSTSHYDVLPLRTSLPIKQRNKSSLSDSNTDVEHSSPKHSDYDILPLRTFSKTQTFDSNTNDLETAKYVPTSDVDSVGQTSISENLNEEVNSNSSSLQTENNSSADVNNVFDEKEDQFGNEAIERVKGREPATRAPSFVVLPRAPSGSMRTAL